MSLNDVVQLWAVQQGVKSDAIALSDVASLMLSHCRTVTLLWVKWCVPGHGHRRW